MSTVRFAPAIHTPRQRQQVSIIFSGAISHYSINAEPAAYTITGTDSTLARGLFINAEPGSYAVTGSDATLEYVAAAPVAVVYQAVKAHTPKLHTRVSRRVSGLTPTVGAYSLNAEPGSYAVTGTDATLARGLFLSCDPGSYAITGSDATLARGLFVNAEPGVYTVTGFEAALVHVATAIPVALRAVKAHTPKLHTRVSRRVSGLAPNTGVFEIVAEPGTYTVTGTDATLARGLFLSCDPGAYAISGSDANLEWSGPVGTPRNTAFIVKAHTPKLREQVSQAINGLTAAVTNDYEIVAEPGTYTVSGAEAVLFYGQPTTWDRIVSPNYAHSTPQIVYGSRQFYGVEVAVNAYELNAQPGTYTVTGTDATLARGLFINADDGAFTVTGANATLARGLFLNAETGVYTLTGFAADLPYGVPGLYTLQADPGAYVITGVDATLAAARLFTASPASFNVSGIAAGLALERTVLTDPGSFAITGTANSMLLTRVLDATAGAIVITGLDAALGDVISTGHFDQPTPSADGYSVGPDASVFDSPTPGVVRT